MLHTCCTNAQEDSIDQCCAGMKKHGHQDNIVCAPKIQNANQVLTDRLTNQHGSNEKTIHRSVRVQIRSMVQQSGQVDRDGDHTDEAPLRKAPVPTLLQGL